MYSCNIGRQPRAMCGDVTSTRCFVTTDFVIENDRLFDVGLPHLPHLTPFRSPSTTGCWITVGIDHSAEQP